MSARVVQPWTRVPEPVVTVVIPTRNRPSHLRRCLITLLDQVGVDMEVIVVDDGSDTPLTGHPELGHLLRDSRVRLIRFDDRRGVAAARDEGIDRARGRWTAFATDDEVWAANKLAAQLAALRLDSLAVWSCTGELHVDADWNVLAMQLPPSGREVVDRLGRRTAVPGTGSSVVASTQKLRDLGGFDPAFSIVADWDLWIRLAEFSLPAVVARPLVGHVHYPGERSPDRRATAKEVERLEAKHHRPRPAPPRVDRFGHYVDLSRVEWKLRRRRRAVGMLLRAAISRPGAPIGLVRTVASGLSRPSPARSGPVEIRLEPSELELQLDHWRARDRLSATNPVLAGARPA